MKLARVLGSVTSTIKHPAYQDQKLLVVVPIDEQGSPTGPSYLAVDRVQAGVGDRVLVLTEGTGVRQIFGLPKTADLPIRSVIVGVVDAVEVSR
jgi:ethanolamine utilization protein EutN